MIASLILCGLIAGTDSDADQLLSKIKSAYHAVHAAEFYVNFEIADEEGHSGKGEVHCEYEFPDHFRAGIIGLPKGPNVVVSDGSSVCTFTADGKVKKSKYTKDKLSQWLPCNVETFAFYDDRELSSGKDGGMHGSALSVRANALWNGKSWTVLHEENKEDSVSVDYFVDTKTDLIWRTRSVDTSTGKAFSDCSVSKLNAKAKISPERFTLPK